LSTPTAMSSVPDLNFSIYTLRIYSRLQSLTSISATLLNYCFVCISVYSRKQQHHSMERKKPPHTRYEPHTTLQPLQ